MQTANKVLKKHFNAASPESERNNEDLDTGFVKQTQSLYFVYAPFCVSRTKQRQPTNRIVVVDARMTQSGAALCGLPMWAPLETLIFGRGLGATAGLNQTG